jgi:DNA-binding GntR family transcriptional regulator
LNQRLQLSEEVAIHLRDLIMAGSLRPGERLRLEELAAQLGVSITPVREALLTLRSEGMVELEPRRGHVVAPMSRQDIDDVFALQANLAAELAARAATRIGAEQLADLTTIQAALSDAAGRADQERIATLEFEFHRSINRVTGARMLARFLFIATRYTPATLYSADPGWRSNMLADHQAVIDAFAAKDPDAARAAMARHFSDGARRLVEHLDEIGMWREPDS